MGLDLGPLKQVVHDLEAAAESVGADLVNQEAGIGQEDLDQLTSALQGVHTKLTGAGTAAAAAPPAAAAAGAGDTAAVAEGAGSAGGSASWTPPADQQQG